jgi:hypothetical protein
MMANLKQWLVEMANGEEIVAVVIGEMGWGEYGSEGVSGYAYHPRGVVLTWGEAAPLLDYEFDDGYGAPNCEAVYAWTVSRAIFVSQYDGSTSPQWMPRNPVACKPEMPGG